MATLQQLRVGLSLDQDKFKAGLSSAKANLKKFGVAAGAMGAVLGALTVRGLKLNDAIEKTGARLSASAAEVSILSGVAAQNDLSLTQMENSMFRVQRMLGEAATKGGAAKKAFDDLGISGREMQTMMKGGVVTQLGMLSDHLRAIKDPAKRAALGYAVLGRQYKDLRTVLSMGSAALNAQADAWAKLGLVISDVEAKDSAAALDAMTRMGGVLDGLTMKMGAFAAPIIIDMVEWLEVKTPAALKTLEAAFRGFHTFFTSIWGDISKVFDLGAKDISKGIDQLKLKVPTVDGKEAILSFENVMNGWLDSTKETATELRAIIPKLFPILSADLVTAAVDTAGSVNRVLDRPSIAQAPVDFSGIYSAGPRDDGKAIDTKHQGEVVTLLRNIDGRLINLNTARATP